MQICHHRQRGKIHAFDSVIGDRDSMIYMSSNIQAAFEDYEWHQMRHKTLVQQLDWLTTHFNAL